LEEIDKRLLSATCLMTNATPVRKAGQQTHLRTLVPQITYLDGSVKEDIFLDIQYYNKLHEVTVAIGFHSYVSYVPHIDTVTSVDHFFFATGREFCQQP